MEVMVAVQSGTLLHALRVQLKRRVSARRGGSSLVNTPQKYKETPLWKIATEKCDLPISLLIPALRGLSQKCDLQNKSHWAECPFA